MEHANVKKKSLKQPPRPLKGSIDAGSFTFIMRKRNSTILIISSCMRSDADEEG
jgi:hypothetical protein